MMTDSKSRNQLHRTAVALNNIGVALLEKNCIGQARQTFHDALHLIQRSDATSCCSKTNQDDSVCSPDTKLRQAMHRLATSVPEPTFSPWTISLQVYTYDPSRLDSMFQDKHGLSSMYSFTPVCIEVRDGNELHHDLGLESSIMVANFGIVNFLLALQHRNTSKQCRFLQIAQQCLYMAYDIVERDSDTPARLILTLVMVNANLQLPSQRDNDETLEFFRARQAQLCMQIQFLWHCDLISASRMAPAA